MAPRTPVIAGNWKMNTDIKSAAELALGIHTLCDDVEGVEKIVCPPFTALGRVSELLSESSIQVGAQNVNSNVNGAFTGEVSASMLVGLTTHVIIGHSERRSMFGEDSDDVAAKALTAINVGLKPILCVGESLEVRRAGNAATFVAEQLGASLVGYASWDSLIVAYEPVWAIGTGEAATSAEAQEMALVCRRVIRQLAPDAAESVCVLYGGSVNSRNVVELLGQPDIDGALVGGASLDGSEFSKLVHSAATM
ncbi:MAG: triose-phosphate isomerase [Chloroflexi bacterium]|nr:triose-phosphate isomerase [Chloroflexota bacterium]